MISYFNQVNFDFFIRTLSKADLWNAILQYKELIRCDFPLHDLKKLYNDLTILETELSKR